MSAPPPRLQLLNVASTDCGALFSMFASAKRTHSMSKSALLLLWKKAFQSEIISVLYVSNSLPHASTGVKSFEAQKSHMKVFDPTSPLFFLFLSFFFFFKILSHQQSFQPRAWKAATSRTGLHRNMHTAAHTSQKAMISTWKAWAVHIYIVPGCNYRASIIWVMEVPALKIYVPGQRNTGRL